MTFIRKIRGEIVRLPLADYNGDAKPGEIVIDDATYNMYIANSTGQLNQVAGGGGGGGGTNIVNGTSNVDIPISGGNVKVGVSGVPDVLNISPTQIDLKANIIPVADAIYSIGAPGAQIKDLYLSNSTLYFDLIPVGVTGSVLTVNGANVITESPNGTSSFANVVSPGNVQANNLIANANIIAPNLIASSTVTATAGLISDQIYGRTGAVSISAVGTDNNIFLNPTGTGYVDVTFSQIKNLDNPTDATDAATKGYVDGIASGLSIHAPVAAATTTSLTGTYVNGASAGVGATFTLAVPTNFIDGYALQIGDRILIKDQTNQVENGIYVRTTTSVFTRATDLDNPSEFAAAYVFVQNGTVNSKSGYVQTGTVTTIGTSNIQFTQFSDAGDYTAGAGLTLTGSAFSISSTGVVSGTYGNTILSPTITVNSRGQVTNITEVPIDKEASNITGSILSSNVLYSSLTSLGTLSSLTVSGVSDLGSNTDVIIRGGTSGQILTTNGVGNVRWDNAPIPTQIANGASNVNIPVGAGNVVVTVGATTSANFNADGMTSGNVTVNSNVTTSNLTVGTKANLGSNGNVIITGGTNGQILSTDGAGTLSWVNPGGGSSNISNGTSNASISVVNGNFDVGINGNATVFRVSDVGIEVNGTSLLGDVANVNIGGGAAGFILSTDGAGLLSWISAGSAGSAISNGTSNVDIATSSGDVTVGVGGVADVLKITSSGANITGTANISGTANLGGALNVGGVSNLGPVGNVKITGGTNGQVLTTDGTGILSWVTGGTGSAISNGTSNVDIATSSGDVTVGVGGVADVLKITSTGANITGTANISGTANLGGALNVGGVSNLGPVGNVKVTGGTNGQVLTTDGTGVLSWTTVSGGSGLANGTSNVSIPSVNGAVNIYSNGIQIADFYSDASTAIISFEGEVNFRSGTAQDINFGTTGSQLGTVNFTRTSNVTLGPVANVHIGGGTVGQVLATDGSGGLSWTTVSGGGGLANGTSNVVIPTIDASVEINTGGSLALEVGTAAIIPNRAFYPSGNRAQLLGSSTNYWGNAYISNTIVNGELQVLGNVLPISNVLYDIGSSSYLFSNVYARDTRTSNVYTDRLFTNGAAAITVHNSLLPSTTDTYDLGSPTQRWNALYLKPATIYLGDTPISVGANNTLIVGNVAVVTQDPSGETEIQGNIVAPGEITANGNITTNGNLITTGNLVVSGVSDLGAVSNVIITGGSSGQVLSTDGIGNLSWITVSGGSGGSSISNADTSITTLATNFILNANGFTIFTGYGNASDPSNPLGTYGGMFGGWKYSMNPSAEWDYSNADSVILGNVANIHISGGSSGQVLSTDGSGNLSWISAGGGGGIGNLIITDSTIESSESNAFINLNSLGNGTLGLGTNDNKDTVIFSGTSSYQWKFDSTGNLTLPGNTFSVNYANGTQVSIGGGGSGSSISNGSSSVSIPQTDGIVEISSNNFVVAYFTGLADGSARTSHFISSINVGLSSLDAANLSVNMSNTGNVTLGSVSNLHITGGTSGQVLSTDGAGNLSWITGGGGGGNSISEDGGNIAISLSKDANSSLFANATVYDPYSNTTKPLFSAVGYNDSANSILNAVFSSQAQYVSFGSPNTIQVGAFAQSVSLTALSDLTLNGSKWPSGYGNNAQVLTTDGSGNLSWEDAGGGGSPTAIVNGTTIVFAVDPYVTITANGTYTWNFNDSGALVVPNVANNQMSISGTSRFIYADPHPAEDSGTVVVWTGATSVCGAKMTLRAKNSTTGHVQMMEILMVKDINNTNSSYTVSNRIKSDSSASDIGISVAIDSGRLQLSATVGADTHTFTYTVDEFQTL